MTTFKRATQGSLPASRTAMLYPSDFADSWEGKPTDAIVVGLRLLSDQEETVAKAGAADEAVKLYEEDDLRIEAYNKLLVSAAVAQAVCDPNNVRDPHPAIPMPEDNLGQILTAAAISRLFDELERLQVDQSVIFREATDEELRELAHLLTVDQPLAELDRVRSRRARRYVAFLLDELNGTDPDPNRSTAGP